MENMKRYYHKQGNKSKQGTNKKSPCLPKTKQKIHILNTIIKPSIAYACYAISFYKSKIKILDKTMIILTE